MPRSKRTAQFWLEHIVIWSDRIASYVEGVSSVEFGSEQWRIDAVSWCIGCIGEACGHILDIDPDLERQYPDLTLSAAYSARNRYVHGYFDLDVAQVWDTSTEAVPRLAAEARRILDGGR